MTDKEKIHLISKMIGNFWELSTEEISKSADVMVNAINTVIEFGGGGEE